MTRREIDPYSACELFGERFRKGGAASDSLQFPRVRPTWRVETAISRALVPRNRLVTWGGSWYGSTVAERRLEGVVIVNNAPRCQKGT